MAVRFSTEIFIAAPPAVVFDLSLDIDTHVDSQKAAKERAIGGVTSGQIKLGEEVTWRATHFHVPFTMTSRITQLDRPHRFVDEQIRGPFRRFSHEHEFLLSGSGTTMIDRVAFDAPLGPLGRLVEQLALGGYLKRLILARGAFLKAEAER